MASCPNTNAAQLCLPEATDTHLRYLQSGINISPSPSSPSPFSSPPSLSSVKWRNCRNWPRRRGEEARGSGGGAGERSSGGGGGRGDDGRDRRWRRGRRGRVGGRGRGCKGHRIGGRGLRPRKRGPAALELRVGGWGAAGAGAGAKLAPQRLGGAGRGSVELHGRPWVGRRTLPADGPPEERSQLNDTQKRVERSDLTKAGPGRGQYRPVRRLAINISRL